MYFGLFSLSDKACSFVFLIHLPCFLPVIVLVPQKFAICFKHLLRCAGIIIASFFALKVPKESTCSHCHRKRLPFNVGIHSKYGGYPICFHVASQLIFFESMLFLWIRVATTIQFLSLYLICLCLAMRVWLEIPILLQFVCVYIS
ncbi:hypothetical protein NC653_028399 [Populus alba x Populus x berolinensis]|uniref:Uncharacterized protein n=1 Tax=Populus alba x Populus x berolinensis TaxID=444605 RepID=A0AAD6M8F4_9ROSI|nr:hypothetical protein NC653_028399 [Populus alba x Populus x berolinensis]